MALDLTSLQNSQSSPLEQLLAAYRAQLSRPLDALKQQQQRLQEQQKLLASLRTTLEELFFTATSLTMPGAERRFITRTVQSSAPEVITATAQQDALLGSVSVHVERLARNDVLASARLNRADPFGLSGLYRFEITAAGTTATVEVTLDGTEDTETALRKIATAINTNSTAGVVATVVGDTATSVRLVLTAKQTGTSAAIRFTDTDGLLAALGWSASMFADPENRTVMTDTGAGYQLGRSSELNALVRLNGLSIIRESNTLTDVLPGVTLTLLRAQQPGDPDVTLTTTVDVEKAASLIQGILDRYNSALKSLSSASKDTLKGNPFVRQLLGQLRTLASQPLGSGPLQVLRDIGITIESDGTLKLSDRSRLERELTAGSQRVAELFTSPGGLGDRLAELLRDAVGSGGTLQTQWQMLGERIQGLSKRIRQTETRIEQQVEQYRKEYLKLQQLYLMATAQLGMLNTFATPPPGMFPSG